MSCETSDDTTLTIIQGSTLTRVYRWATDVLSYAAITGITQAAPAVVTATGHGIPDGWPVKVKDVVGMTEINSNLKERISTLVTANSVRLNGVNASGYTAYASGGVLEFKTPVNLANYTARLQIRSSVSATTFITELTTENGGIAINTTDRTITITIAAAVTAAYTWTRAVYSLELIDENGVVTQIASGGVSVAKEITR